MFKMDEITLSYGLDPRDVLASLDIKSAQCLREGRINSYYRYRSTASAIRRTLGPEAIPPSGITPDLLRTCEESWRAYGLSDTTINIYMRSLRCILNAYCCCGAIERIHYPFGRGRYSIPYAASRKLALSRAQVTKVLRWHGREDLEEWRDLWAFSYMCNGINFRDLLFLKYCNIIDGELEFVRSKTMNARNTPKVIRAAIIPEMSAIMQRWGGKNRCSGDYIFRFARDGMTPLEVTLLVRKVTCSCNRALKIIAAEVGVPKITTYTARHSYATVLKRSGVDISYISESLGHSSILVTQTYLEGFEKEERARCSKLLVHPGNSHQK